MKITRAPARGGRRRSAPPTSRTTRGWMCLAMWYDRKSADRRARRRRIRRVGLLRRYCAACSRRSTSRETGGQSQITLGERHPDTVRRGGGAARAAAEGGGGAVARMPKAPRSMLPEAASSRRPTTPRVAWRPPPAMWTRRRWRRRRRSSRTRRRGCSALVDEVHAVELKRRLVREGRWRQRSRNCWRSSTTCSADAPTAAVAAAARRWRSARARARAAEGGAPRGADAGGRLRAARHRHHLQRLRAAAQLADAGDALHAEAERRAEQIHRAGRRSGYARSQRPRRRSRAAAGALRRCRVARCRARRPAR